MERPIWLGPWRYNRETRTWTRKYREVFGWTPQLRTFTNTVPLYTVRSIYKQVS